MADPPRFLDVTGDPVTAPEKEDDLSLGPWASLAGGFSPAGAVLTAEVDLVRALTCLASASLAFAFLPPLPDCGDAPRSGGGAFFVLAPVEHSGADFWASLSSPLPTDSSE